MEAKKELIRKGIELLERELGNGRTYGDTQRLKIRDELRDQPGTAIEDGFDWLILNSSPGQLPWPTKISATVEDARKRRAEKETRQREEDAANRRRESAEISRVQPQSEIGRHVLKMILKFWPDDGTVPYQEILADCEQIGRLFPSSGFGSIADDWRQEWTGKKLLPQMETK